MKVFSLIMLIVGGFVGAGFASGKEVACYMSSLGNMSWIAIIIVCILLFLLLQFFLTLSYKFKNFKHFILYNFGKGAVIINILFALSLLILISSMFAGSAVVANELNLNKIIILFLTFVLTLFVCLGDIKRIAFFNKILVPIMLIIILINCCNFSCNNVSYSASFFQVILNSSNYVFINIVTLGMFVLDIGKKYSRKEHFLASLLSVLIIGIVLVFCNVSIINYGLIDNIMPIIYLANMRGKVLKFLTVFTIWTALFTTLVSNVYMLSSYVSKFIKNKFINLFVILFLGVLISGVGFDIIVAYIYSFIGVVGLVIVVLSLCKKRDNFSQSSLK